MRDGKFIAVGSDQQVQSLIGPDTRVIEGDGKTITPGFYDAHLHPEPVYPEMSRLGIIDCDPSKVKNLDELIEKLKGKASRTPKPTSY